MGETISVPAEEQHFTDRGVCALCSFVRGGSFLDIKITLVTNFGTLRLLFVCLLLVFFETGFLSVALAVLALAL